MTFTHEAQESIGYTFRQPALLDEALTHRSHLQGKHSTEQKDNERLEFLGDAVLSLVVSEYLSAAYPTSTEGELSKVRARLVSRVSLAQAASRLKLGQLLRVGRGEEVTKGRGKSSLLANALEAVIAAIYLDGGLEPARSFVLRTLSEEFGTLQGMTLLAYNQDFKSQFQEQCQQRFEALPVYTVRRESGPDHNKAFEVEVGIRGKIYGWGLGRNKKEAEQMAAKQALDQLFST